jgi:hypothetical protein
MAKNIRRRQVRLSPAPECQDESGLVEAADMHYVRSIEFRPDDLASPRYASD